MSSYALVTVRFFADNFCVRLIYFFNAEKRNYSKRYVQ